MKDVSFGSMYDLGYPGKATESRTVQHAVTIPLEPIATVTNSLLITVPSVVPLAVTGH